MRQVPFVVLFGLFLVSRLVGVFFFAPHNDEVIFIDFAQTIAGDWSLRFLTLDGSIGDEYKLPLHFWLTAAVLPFFDDPLLAARFALLFFTGTGFVCAWLLITRLIDRLTGDLLALLVLFSGYHLYFDSVAVTEGILYGTGAIYLYFLYLSISSSSARARGFTFALATLALFFSIGAKESGLLWILPALLLAWWPRPGETPDLRARLKFTGTTLGSVALALIFRYVFITRGFEEIRRGSIQFNMVRSADELLSFPLEAWANNLRFYLFDTLGPALDVALIPAVPLVVWSLARLVRADSAERNRALLLLGLFAVSFLPVVILAKTQFVRIFGVGLYFAFAPGAFATARFLRRHVIGQKIWRTYLVGAACLLLCVWHGVFTIVPLLRDGQTRVAMTETPDARANGAGIMELIRRVETLPPGFLFYDPRWGHPGTTIKVFHARFPAMEIAPAIPPVLANLDSLRPLLGAADRPLYFVFSSGAGAGFRPEFLRVLTDPEFCADKFVIEKRFQNKPLGEQLLVCRVGAVRRP